MVAKLVIFYEITYYSLYLLKIIGDSSTSAENELSILPKLYSCIRLAKVMVICAVRSHRFRYVYTPVYSLKLNFLIP